MTYRAHVRNGKIELDRAATLPEGAEIELRIVGLPTAEADGLDEAIGAQWEASAFGMELDRLWADVPDSEWDKLPPDLSDQLDHYLYGTPKK